MISQALDAGKVYHEKSEHGGGASSELICSFVWLK